MTETFSPYGRKITYWSDNYLFFNKSWLNWNSNNKWLRAFTVRKSYNIPFNNLKGNFIYDENTILVLYFRVIINLVSTF